MIVRVPEPIIRWTGIKAYYTRKYYMINRFILNQLQATYSNTVEITRKANKGSPLYTDDDVVVQCAMQGKGAEFGQSCGYVRRKKKFLHFSESHAERKTHKMQQNSSRRQIEELFFKWRSTGFLDTTWNCCSSLPAMPIAAKSAINFIRKSDERGRRTDRQCSVCISHTCWLYHHNYLVRNYGKNCRPQCPINSECTERSTWFGRSNKFPINRNCDEYRIRNRKKESY